MCAQEFVATSDQFIRHYSKFVQNNLNLLLAITLTHHDSLILLQIAQSILLSTSYHYPFLILVVQLGEELGLLVGFISTVTCDF